MLLEEVDVIKSDDRGVILDCGRSNFISRKKGTVSADHTHDENEIVYLVKGEVELTMGEETQIVKAPVKFVAPPNIYHKLVALTDIEMVIDRGKSYE
ncbi:cupin domain-containing protein [Patescibacteria group bacterium]|nr:cupin domain-containing protein [Patescibacteria group bacterium]MBU1075201.1 cupin domain-containing protein [Patescibacteria group bacterium]MBU1951811.1 cupin domain-containing protein [Patescibacteria group bacterium]